MYMYYIHSFVEIGECAIMKTLWMREMKSFVCVYSNLDFKKHELQVQSK